MNTAPPRLIVVSTGEPLQYMDTRNISESKKQEYVYLYKYADKEKRYVAFTHNNLMAYIEKALLKPMDMPKTFIQQTLF